MRPPASTAIDLSRLPDGIHRPVLPDGRDVFAKVRRGVPAGFFAAEARGLRALAQARALRVPGVIAVDAIGIALEDLGSGRAQTSDWERAGHDLATLHAHAAARFGFPSHGWCGNSAQDNTPDEDGARFFGLRRLRPQARRAFDVGLLDSGDLERIERLCLRLAELLPPCPPVLVHGDLWLGNLHACSDGRLALVDGGAVHHGRADADLAMLTLFGEPPRAFFAAYEAASGSGSQWRSHAPLLNLYHLLNHLNLFGGAYQQRVRRVVAAFA